MKQFFNKKRNGWKKIIHLGENQSTNSLSYNTPFY